jgi:hypothetical protein
MVSATVAVCVNDPELPVKVIVVLPAVAAAEAVMVTLCVTPGVSVSAEGCAVTPLGNPLIATDTVPLNPLIAATFTLICCPVPPAPRAIAVGVEDKVKSGTGAGREIVSAAVITWLSVPELPVRVIIALPAVVAAEAVIVTLCATPGVSISVEGCAVTPLGSPLIATDTVPLNPLTGTALTLICCPAPPDISEIAVGVEDKEKSGAGSDPPPQEAVTKQRSKAE